MDDQKTIFEGLYQIDWSQASAYDETSPYAIPRAIRDLLSNDEFIRDGARSFLCENVITYFEEDHKEAQSKFYDVRNDCVTPRIFHFMLEALFLTEMPVPDKACILDELSWLLKASNHDTSKPAYKAIYSILSPSMPRFIELLNMPDTDLQRATIDLLKEFKDQVAIIFPHFVKHFKNETSISNKIVLLKSAGYLLADIEQTSKIIEIRETFLSLCWTTARIHSSYGVRSIAALIGVWIAHNKSSDVPDFVAPLILESFLILKASYDNRNNRTYSQEGRQILAQSNLLPIAHEALSGLLKYQLDTYDLSLVKAAIPFFAVAEPKPESFVSPNFPSKPVLIFNRIGDVFLNTVKSLLPSHKDQP